MKRQEKTYQGSINPKRTDVVIYINWYKFRKQCRNIDSSG